ncbi:hypothetical protein F9C07_10499 [Aspergillus flavus]|uniref:Uncharacterized protein n=1 Tax=Aspergillus flavus (strain ATCC 200026 / FGSC A1120 / IAM 13836 / NRRL 3357 / JCM 12722 / SRRC 167) TaxID=332952 RepID=A0A7U2MVK8_ASPFN|nr:hypothetical protein AFLA_011768 [Aspergillus flavus NRRL3357]KAJ1713033.1 hypothetical protein NYO67_4785 [Aspergillus flavus]KOC13489.1 hypothetical protein AFLA70_11g005490 [Aspergillus flavus AF70]QRD90681.1 hypothetical protein F9C07_10499 [Aspergillus flavus]
MAPSDSAGHLCDCTFSMLPESSKIGMIVGIPFGAIFLLAIGLYIGFVCRRKDPRRQNTAPPRSRTPVNMFSRAIKEKFPGLVGELPGTDMHTATGTSNVRRAF